MASLYTVCFVTAEDEKTASALAEGLVGGRLAACVSVIGGVSSTYRWRGKVEKAEERLLIIKTRKSLISDVVQFVKRNHAAETPEIIFMDITGGSRDYLNWLGSSTLFTTNIPKDKTGRTF